MLLNGEELNLDALGVQFLQELLLQLKIQPEAVAVEHNGQIPERSTWPGLRLSNGDRIEIIHFVGGG